MTSKMNSSSAQVHFRYEDVRGNTRESYADRTSKYSTASEGDDFESANEGSDTDNESECLSFPQTEIVPPITPAVINHPQGIDTLRPTRTQSVASQITIRPGLQHRHTPMEFVSSDPFKSPGDALTSRSRSNSTAEVESFPPLSGEHNRTRSLSTIRGPTPPVATRGGKSPSDVAVQRTSSFNNISTIVTFENTIIPAQNAHLRPRPVTAMSTTSTPSIRETFSSPPLLSRSLSYASVAGASGGSGTSTPSIAGQHSTAASSALALTAHVPGLGAKLSMYESKCLLSGDALVEFLNNRNHFCVLQIFKALAPNPPWTLITI